MYNSFIRIARRLFSKHLQIHYIGDKDGDFRAETGYRRREFCALKGPFCPRGNESKHNSFVLHIRRNTTIPPPPTHPLMGQRFQKGCDDIEANNAVYLNVWQDVCYFVDQHRSHAMRNISLHMFV